MPVAAHSRPGLKPERKSDAPGSMPRGATVTAGLRPSSALAVVTVRARRRHRSFVTAGPSRHGPRRVGGRGRRAARSACCAVEGLAEGRAAEQDGVDADNPPDARYRLLDTGQA
ncbi:hypothetical protein SAV14893_074440 [Streptomyces avermitilis]|uniref:Uncharacterized protein n=1 Tax=Streptomyces avermitilis TaxID=33903 RepID=A0A4D4M7V7_STRAX|nr:hypothetical protein SAVMC3_87420 [Streptomyces avermitilis]GDY68051.1 hypothetical protein SAV14893_074440 [Streptomyces avermitilis]GDY71612.1 hypothetical protein SAV31267_010970 [Streptomyces avermitilis]